MKRYPKYKDSGVEWLGEIPEHWEVKRLKFLAKIKTGEKDTIDKEENGKYPFFVRSQTVERLNTYSYDEEAVLTAGDGVGVGKVFHYINGKFECHQRVYKISDFKEISGKYFFYYIKNNLYAEVIKISAKSTVDSLRLPMFLNFPVSIPTISEQKQITYFLDHKLEQIEQYIRNKKRLIELLNEQKTAIINRAVTKGINPNAPMKDSGIRWLGEIPAHWEAKLFRRVTTRIEVGIAEAATHAYTEEGIPIIRSTNVKTNFIELDNILHIQKWFADKNCSKYIYTGDILTVRTGVNAGMTSVVPKELNHSQCFTLLISTPSPQHLPQFYSFYINSPMGQYFFSIEGWGAAQVNLSVPILQNLPVVEPPYEEQKAIVYFIEKESAKVDVAIAQVEKEIELIQEYRTTLISEAVTGKIDVRPNSLIETTLTA